MNVGISLADSTEFIRFPCFSEMLCKISFAPVAMKEFLIPFVGEMPNAARQLAMKEFLSPFVGEIPNATRLP